MKQNEVQNSQKKKRITEIDLKQLINQLIIRVMNHKKNRLRQNSKSLKIESNLNSKSDTKNNSNSNSNSNFNFRKSKSDKEKEKIYQSYNENKICSYCHKKNHEELHCRMKN